MPKKIWQKFVLFDSAAFTLHHRLRKHMLKWIHYLLYISSVITMALYERSPIKLITFSNCKMKIAKHYKRVQSSRTMRFWFPSLAPWIDVSTVYTIGCSDCDLFSKSHWFMRFWIVRDLEKKTEHIFPRFRPLYCDFVFSCQKSTEAHLKSVNKILNLFKIWRNISEKVLRKQVWPNENFFSRDLGLFLKNSFIGIIFFRCIFTYMFLQIWDQHKLLDIVTPILTLFRREKIHSQKDYLRQKYENRNTQAGV
jgi:hypothetical protein